MRISTATLSPGMARPCLCFSCSSLCRITPGIPTPDEVEKLIALGYGWKLINIIMNNVSIVLPKKEWSTHHCVFFRRSKCEIHNIAKPLQCRGTMGCVAVPRDENYPNNERMLLLWDTERGRETVRNFRSLN